jgi:hypothetical protein
VIFLVPYALVMTAAFLIVYWKWSTTPHPFEMLPDLEGVHPGAKRSERLMYDRRPPDAPLPAKLRTTLGQPLRVGDLEVTPLKVEQRRVTLLSNIHQRPPSLAPADSLVLTLHLKNTASDVVFYPTDPFFERRSRPADPGNTRPYTYLELLATHRRYWGGPLEWEARRRPGAPREWLEGQDPNQALQPGEEMTTVVATSWEDDLARALKAYHGNLLWRVQLRCGLARHLGRSRPATAVVGVEFLESEIEPKH